MTTHEYEKILCWRVIIFLCVVTLSGCDNSGNSTARVIAPLSGSFSGLAISGLNYATATQSGTIDADGSFKYMQGEVITFSIGALILGDAVPASSSMMLIDLIPHAKIYTTHAEVVNVLTKNLLSSEQRAFRESTNLIALLHMCDADGDADNGIDIPQALGAFFANKSIPLNVSIVNFAMNAPVRDLMYEARRAGILNNVSIKLPGLVLDHYYAVNNITTNFKVASVTTVDYEMENRANQVFQETFDAFGNLSLAVVDNEGDGALDSIYTYNFNALGLISERIFDHNADNVPELLVSSFYDEFGITTRIENHSDVNGTANETQIVILNTNGSVASYRTDTGADGIIDRITTVTYTESGLQASNSTDFEADGIIDSSTTFAYDENDRLIMLASDTDADGTPNSVTKVSFNASGTHSLTEKDTNNDGIIDEIRTFINDENGNFLSSVSDTNADGVPDYARTLVYDDKGNNVREESGLPFEDFSHVSTMVYDEAGNRISKSTDYDFDGEAETITTWVYDEYGNVLSMTVNSTLALGGSVTTYENINANWTSILNHGPEPLIVQF